jgi:hypothetical protein
MRLRGRIGQGCMFQIGCHPDEIVWRIAVEDCGRAEIDEWIRETDAQTTVSCDTVASTTRQADRGLTRWTRWQTGDARSASKFVT